MTFDPRQPVIVEARYQVALMSPDEATIRLPLSNVTLAGANACRVNHRPHPIRKTDDAFLLTLNSSDSNSGRLQTLRPIGSGELRQPVRAVRPRAKEVAKSGGRSPKAALHGSKALSRPRIYEIVLSFFPETSGAATAAFEFGLPKVAGALLQIVKPGPPVPMALETDDGQVRKIVPGTVAIVEVRETAWLRIAADSPRPAATSNLEGRAAQFIRLSPDVIEMDCRASYAAVPGGIEEIEWTVPAAAVVRGLEGNFRTLRGAPTADGRWVSLKFVLIKRTDRPVTLGDQLMIPSKAVPKLGKPPHFMIPLVRFSGGPGIDRSGYRRIRWA